MSPTRGRTALLCADLIIVAVAFCARLLYLGDANIWSDEGLSVWGARQTLAASALYTAGDVHPALYFWLLHYWLAAAGATEFAVRLLSVAVGTLTVPVAGYLGRLLLPSNPWVARAGMLLLALSRFSVWWSQEARMYILGAFFATLSLALAVRLRRRFSRTVAVAYVLVAAAGLWSLYLTLFGLLIQGLYWLWTLRQESSARAAAAKGIQWAALQACVLLCFLPWLAFMLPRLPGWSKQVQFDPGQFLQIYATLMTVGVSADIERWRPVVAAVLVAGVAGVVLLFVRPQWRGAAYSGALALLLLAVVVPPATVWLVTTMPRSFGKPEARYLVPFVPPAYLLLAWAGAGLAALAGRRRAIAGASLVAAMAILSCLSLGDYYSNRYLADEYKSVALTLRAHVRPGDSVVLHTNDTWPAFAYEWARPFFSTPPSDGYDNAGAAEFLTPVWEASGVVWLVLNENAVAADPGRVIESWLAARAMDTRQWRFGSRRILAFARDQNRAAALDELAPGYAPPRPQGAGGSAGGLAGWEQPLMRLRAGDIAHGFVYVQQQASPVTVTVGLADRPAASTVITAPAGTGLSRLTASIALPAGTAAGDTSWFVAVGGKVATVGSVRLLAAPAVLAPAAGEPRFRVGAGYGDPPLIRLSGYDLDGEASPGRQVKVTLHWAAVSMPPQSYKVFVHVADASGRVVAQRDDFPLGGKWPTTLWVPGEAVVDGYSIPLPSGIALGSYSLVVGLYDPATGVRLSPARDAFGRAQPLDQIVLGKLEVRAE